jgi:hypothetical protein
MRATLAASHAPPGPSPRPWRHAPGVLVGALPGRCWRPRLSRRRGLLAGQRQGRAGLRAPRSSLDARRPRKPRPPLAGGVGLPSAPRRCPGRAGEPGWPAVERRQETGRRSARCPRTAPRRGRGARTRGAPKERASRAKPAGPGQSCRRGPPLLRGRRARSSGSSGSSSSSWLVRRERSIPRHTRDTTVVSHPAEVVDALGVGAVQADPGLLYRVLCRGEGTEHAVGHRLQPRPGGFELGT